MDMKRFKEGCTKCDKKEVCNPDLFEECFSNTDGLLEMLTFGDDE